MATKHGNMVTLREGPPPINSYKLLNMCSRDKLKTLCLRYHNAYGHKNYQGADIPEGAPTYKFA